MTARAPLPVARGRRGLWPALALAMLAGCESAPPQPVDPATLPSGPALGTVTVVRPEVTVNRRPVRDTVPLNDGDKVATNARGRAHIDLPGHGAVDLEENTDPYFIREGACVLVRLLFGTGRIRGIDICVEDEQRNRIIMNSGVYVETDRQQTIITVLDGTVRLRTARDGTVVTLSQGERIAIENAGLRPRDIVPPTQLDAIRQRFMIPIPPPLRLPPPPPPPSSR